jgi:hypothetical protein
LSQDLYPSDLLFLEPKGTAAQNHSEKTCQKGKMEFVTPVVGSSFKFRMITGDF